MTTIEAVKNRKSIREYLKKEVSNDLIKEILEVARFSPSSTNTQPWEVCVVTGQTKRKLDEKMTMAFKNGEKPQMDYTYYPDTFPQSVRERQIKLGKNMYGLLGIAKDDKKASQEQWAKNYTAFDAPVCIYVLMDKTLENGSYLDIGMFVQTLALVATEKGLSTCLQGSLAQYPNIVREELNIKSDKMVLCGIALGYEKKDSLINSFKSDRMKVEEFTKFYM